MSGRTLIVGTRGSRLALEQARRVQEALPGSSALSVIRTSGDRFGDRPLGEATQVGFFTKEIEEELLQGTIDLAVHSLKDLPTRLAAGLELGAVLKRDDPSDVLLVNAAAHDPHCPLPVAPGATVGASSLRRQALLGKFAPDLVPRPIRGNVPTRIAKAIQGEYGAIILSRAGVERLGLDVAPLLTFELNPRLWTCAPGQATIAVEIRQGDEECRGRLAPLHDEETWRTVQAERAQLKAFGGGCHVPFGAYARRMEVGYEVFVAAPRAAGDFGVERFVAAGLEEAGQAAEAWVRSGRPARSGEEVAEWLCRPARPWC